MDVKNASDRRAAFVGWLMLYKRTYLRQEPNDHAPSSPNERSKLWRQDARFWRKARRPKAKLDRMKRYWPDDADGDVMRRLEASGFEFEAEHAIDFNVDFETWPPSREFIEQLKATYPTVDINAFEDGASGEVRFIVEAKLSYELVMFVQESVSAIAKPYGGRCESWGVLH